jgi:hypothetical protein
MSAKEIQPKSIRPTFVPQQRDEVASVEVDGEAVLYDERVGSLHVLNVTAALLWQCFDGTGSIDDIAADMADAFGTDPSVVRKDVLKITRQLGRQGLLAGVAPDPKLMPPVAHTVEAEPVTEGPRFLDEPPNT